MSSSPDFGTTHPKRRRLFILGLTTALQGPLNRMTLTSPDGGLKRWPSLPACLSLQRGHGLGRTTVMKVGMRMHVQTLGKLGTLNP